MTLTIRCDYVDEDWKPCRAELSCMAFNAKPEGWLVVELGHGDHADYCPEHSTLTLAAAQCFEHKTTMGFCRHKH